MVLHVLDSCSAFDVPVNGMIHVGANRGTEYPAYHARTNGPLLYVEAIPELAEFVRRRLDPNRQHFVRQAVVTDVRGQRIMFHVASNDGLSSSLLGPGRHADIYPDITFDNTLELESERLDDIIAERSEAQKYNVLLMDVQGAELKVLRGAPKLLERVDAVFAEVSSEALYEDGCTFLEVSNFLAEAGLIFRAAEMNHNGYGDAFYSRRQTTLHDLLESNLALGKPTSQSSYYDGAPSWGAETVDNTLPNDFGVHTAAYDTNPWWEVDLGTSTEISRVLYLDRPRFASRSASLQISTSHDGQQYNVLYRRAGTSPARILDIGMSTRARFVRVGLVGSAPLHFRKVIIC